MERCENLKFEIFSVFGESLISGFIYSNNQEIDLSNLSAGIYFLRIGKKVFKVLKQ